MEKQIYKENSFHNAAMTALKTHGEVYTRKELLTEAGDAHSLIPNFIRADGFTCVEKESVLFAKPICQIVDSKNLSSGVTYYKSKDGFFKESHAMQYAESKVEAVSMEEALQVFDKCMTTSNIGAGEQYYASKSFKEDADILRNGIKVSEFSGERWKVEFYIVGVSYKEIYAGTGNNGFFAERARDVDSSNIETHMMHYAKCVIQDNENREIDRMTSNNRSQQVYVYEKGSKGEPSSKVVQFWKLNNEEQYFKKEYEYTSSRQLKPLTKSKITKQEMVEEILNEFDEYIKTKLGGNEEHREVLNHYEEVLGETLSESCQKLGIRPIGNRLSLNQFEALRNSSEQRQEPERPAQKFGSFDDLIRANQQEPDQIQNKPQYSPPQNPEPVIRTQDNGKPELPDIFTPHRQSAPAGRGAGQFGGNAGRKQYNQPQYNAPQYNAPQYNAPQYGQKYNSPAQRDTGSYQNDPTSRILENIKETCEYYGLSGDIEHIKGGKGICLCLKYSQNENLSPKIHVSIPDKDAGSLRIWRYYKDKSGEFKTFYASARDAGQGFFDKYSRNVQSCFNQLIRDYGIYVSEKNYGRNNSYRNDDYGYNR